MRILGIALAIVRTTRTRVVFLTTRKCVERSGARRPKGLGVANGCEVTTWSEVMCHEVHYPDELSVDPGTVWKSRVDRRKSRMDGIVR